MLPGIIGCLQANEAIKLVLGVGSPLIGRLVVFDALEMEFRELALAKSEDCPVCGDEPTLTELIDYEQFCGLDVEEEPVEPDFEISVEELKSWRDEGREHVVLDVRTPPERMMASIDGSLHIPMNELLDRIDEIDADTDVVVHCHHGPRSTQAVTYLRANGFPRARNLTGGIDAWSVFVDRDVPRY